jgi:beta-lactam-binding protein with PASTA domain
VHQQPADPLVGTLVDRRYQVLSRVARGGMSTVYLATDTRLDRSVALKVLHPHLATDSGFLQRLSGEAKAAARLSHPHVVGMLDQGNDGGLAYLVMEYLPGHTLRDVLNERGALPPRLALAYLDAIVEGLGAAHAAGLVHRDVKPENVLIADDGRIKIGDFGLARAVTTTTNTATLIGTVAYISPELVNGQPADARSDIYSVGIMFYEMLTGRQPFRGDLPIQVAMQHVGSTVPPPSEELPGLSTELDELVRCCTERDPEARPADGNALLEDLRHIRTTLSNAQLDFGSPGIAALPASGHAPTEPIGRVAAGNGAHPTVVLGGRANATSVLPGSVLPAAGQGVPAAGARPVRPPSSVPAGSASGAPAPGRNLLFPPEDTADLERPAPRPSKRENREALKARSKAAATPSQALRRGNPRRRGLLWVAVLLVLALLAAAAGWFFGLGPGALATVPDVHNRTVAEAQALLADQGFSSTTEDVFDESVLQGLVVRSDPEPRTQQRRFQPVTLLVSKGPVLYAVPRLAGGTLAAAKSALNAAKLALGSVTEQYDEDTDAGTVLAQDPAAGAQKREATPVNLVVSKGPTPIPVPAVVGKPKDQAVQALTAAGLKAEVEDDEVFDRTVPAGSVVAQDPSNGTLTRGQTVRLTISKGPRMVRVPSYIGKQVQSAVHDLEQAGFQVKVNNILGGFFGTVRDQNPVNQDVPEGSVITLTVV